jgi:hypothetical protein
MPYDPQKAAEDFLGRITGRGNRADETLDTLTSKPAKANTAKGHDEKTLAAQLGRAARGPQHGAKKSR